MTTGQMIEYLENFPSDKEVACLVFNLDERERHPVIRVTVIEDDEIKSPCLIFETGKPEKMDEE